MSYVQNAHGKQSFCIPENKIVLYCKKKKKKKKNSRVTECQACLKVSKWMQEGLFLVEFHLQFNNVNSGGQN